MKITIDKLYDFKLQVLKKKYASYKLIDITYDASSLIKFKRNEDTSFKERIILSGCPLYIYLVFSNEKEIILVKYKTIKYYYVGQIIYFLNNCKIIYNKDLSEWRRLQTKLNNLSTKKTSFSAKNSLSKRKKGKNRLNNPSNWIPS